MLPVQHRITHGDDYRRVLGRGKKSRTSIGLVSITENSVGYLRFGFVVSKAVGNAVARNVVKRRLRAAAHRLLGDFDSMDVVVKATPGSSRVSVSEAEGVFREVLSK